MNRFEVKYLVPTKRVPEIMAELARLHRRRGAWRELCEVRMRQAALAESPGDRTELLAEAAQILEGQLSDREAAARACASVVCP